MSSTYQEWPQSKGTAVRTFLRETWNDFHPETFRAETSVCLLAAGDELFLVDPVRELTLAPLGARDGFDDTPLGTFSEPVTCAHGEHGRVFIHPMRFQGERYVRYLVGEVDAENPRALNLMTGFHMPAALHCQVWSEWLAARGCSFTADPFAGVSEDDLGPPFERLEELGEDLHLEMFGPPGQLQELDDGAGVALPPLSHSQVLDLLGRIADPLGCSQRRLAPPMGDAVSPTLDLGWSPGEDPDHTAVLRGLERQGFQPTERNVALPARDGDVSHAELEATIDDRVCLALVPSAEDLQRTGSVYLFAFL